jgi:hypothetical protein
MSRNIESNRSSTPSVETQGIIDEARNRLYLMIGEFEERGLDRDILTELFQEALNKRDSDDFIPARYLRVEQDPAISS